MRRLLIVFTRWATALALVCGPAVARERPAFKNPSSPMRVVIVRSSEAGCEPACAEWLSAQGKITAGTPEAFRRALQKMGARKLPVLIHSRGGLIPAALEIGRMLRAQKLDIHVSGTLLETCASGDNACAARRKADEPLGEPASVNAQCASACSFILAAGTQRLVPPLSQVGVHRAIAFRTQVRLLRQYRVTWRVVHGRKIETSRKLVSEKEVSRITSRIEAPESATRHVARYFAEMGVSKALLPLIAATPSSDIHWLSAEELTATGLATARGGGPAYIAELNVAGRAARRVALAAIETLAAPPPKPATTAELKVIAPPEGEPPSSPAPSPSALTPEAAPVRPDASATARLGPIDDRFIDLEMRFSKNPMSDGIFIEVLARLNDQPFATAPLTLHFDLPGAKSFAAKNAKTDQPNAALGAIIPRLDFCELLFDPWTTLRLENGAGGQTALQTQLFKKGELKTSGLCPLWKPSGATG